MFDAALGDELHADKPRLNTDKSPPGPDNILANLQKTMAGEPTCWVLRNMQAMFPDIERWGRDAWQNQERLLRLVDSVDQSHRFVLLFPDEGRIPGSFLAGVPGIARMSIPVATQAERLEWSKSVVEVNRCLKNESVREAFVSATDGLRWQDLDSLRRQCREDSDMLALVREFKFGKQKDAWAALDVKRLAGATDVLNKGEAIRGQDEAVKRALAVVAKARFNLSRVVSPTYNRPRGVMFFVGPTGVGKTMLAKKLAKLIFYDENACTVFDMTEYREEHSGARMIGAPPGFIGYDEGGQLTRAVREKPFSILLFDEIDKAHPELLMNFMQILDEGRLTDGKGQTCYFSECLIIFTSNAGAADLSQGKQELADGTTVDRAGEYALLQRYYQERLQATEIFAQHPEILSRIALQNIVPFRHLSDRSAVVEVVDGLIENTRKMIYEEWKTAVSFESPEELAENISKRSRFETFGLRNAKQTYELEVLEPIATAMLRSPKTIKVQMQGDSVTTDE